MEERKDDSTRVKFSGLILPWLDHLYRLFLDPLIKKHNLIIAEEFWIFISLSVFSGILYFTKVGILVPIVFFVGAVIVLLLHNSSYIRRKIFPKDSEKIDDFINNLKSKQLEEVLIFIKDYQLDTSQIIKIIEHRKDSQDVFVFIKKYQSIKSELIEYLISNKLYTGIDADLFGQYLINSINHISKEKYDLLRSYLLTQPKNKKIVKILNLCYPFYLQNHLIFKFFSNLLADVRHFVNYGGMKLGVFILSMTLVVFVLSKDPSILRINTPPNTFLLGIGNVFSVIMGSLILTMMFLLVIKYVLKIVRVVLCLFAPND